jgi:RNA polymerase sigma-70 factor (ECF subfamily)
MATLVAPKNVAARPDTADDRREVRLIPAWVKGTPPDVSHTALVDGCLAGDRKAQQRVYEQFYGRMMAVSMRYTKNVDQAKDILQDAFIKVFGSMDQFNRAGSFEGWIRRIVVNTAIDNFRRSKNAFLLLGEDLHMEDFGDTGQEDPGGVDETDVLQDLKPADIINAMQKLTPAYRTVFNLYVFEELTHKEIAGMLGINVGTSKSNLAKAKHNLKKLLTDRR